MAFREFSALFAGKSQQVAARALFASLITDGKVLLVGAHGAFKSSMIRALSSLISTKYAVAEKEFSDVREVKEALSSAASKLGVNLEELERNLVYGVNMKYGDAFGVKKLTLEIDEAYHEEAPRLKECGFSVKEEVRRLPSFVMLVSPSDEIQDYVGHPVTSKVLRGDWPPHLEKENSIAHAPFILLDEMFVNPKLAAAMHTFVNEKEIHYPGLGTIRTDYLLFAAATNPVNENYQTNPNLRNMATLDRFTICAFVSTPDSRSVEETIRKLEILKDVPPLIDEKTIFSARSEVEKMPIEKDAEQKLMLLADVLDSCFFSTAQMERRERGTSPFLIQHECSLCVFKDTCLARFASVSTTRFVISVEKVAKAVAYLSGKQKAEMEDVAAAIFYVLPHRAKWSEDFIEENGGNVQRAVVGLLERFSYFLRKYEQDVKRVVEASEKGDVTTLLTILGLNPNAPKEAVGDVAFVKALADQALKRAEATLLKHRDFLNDKKKEATRQFLETAGDEETLAGVELTRQ
ncbi:hypothetical protein B9Q03_11735 [Candidatus Marsarchaeota G2 archaeon OSP_D]|jgi:hypothetical protein|uniref:ChlI/MoxR AAA lid domain-containing protein n=1 Tax=Candidatus Marsarchaeota G2 archaeon OSP_D TaxID=1978157 RepID=A0A2R6AJ35_9ARCH|nr:MAG: hypothetical protein B9Q03_11735 [Candidatus Marsarchaeota G2 archaeon OSP_D]